MPPPFVLSVASHDANMWNFDWEISQQGWLLTLNGMCWRENADTCLSNFLHTTGSVGEDPRIILGILGVCQRHVLLLMWHLQPRFIRHNYPCGKRLYKLLWQNIWTRIFRALAVKFIKQLVHASHSIRFPTKWMLHLVCNFIYYESVRIIRKCKTNRKEGVKLFVFSVI